MEKTILSQEEANTVLEKDLRTVLKLIKAGGRYAVLGEDNYEHCQIDEIDLTHEKLWFLVRMIEQFDKKISQAFAHGKKVGAEQTRQQTLNQMHEILGINKIAAAIRSFSGDCK